MTTLFIDYEGGNDDYGGTSFALLASGTDGRITSTTFSSATASFPNDGSLINQYLTIWNASIYAAYKITAWISGTSLTIEAISGGTALANQAVDRQYYIGGRWKTLTSGATAVRTVPGDTLRMMASPDATSVGDATWTNWFDDTRSYTTKAISSSTNASPIEITTSAAHGLVTGDYALIENHATNLNANGVWKVTYVSDTKFTLNDSTGSGVGSGGTVLFFSARIVELDTACTAKIADCSYQEGAWTASASVTATVNTSSWKAHYGCANIVIDAAFTTGLAAYKALSGATDYSGYQQISLTYRQTAGTVSTDSDLSIKLCSDAAGATPVDTINLPSTKVLNNWTTVTIDTAGALGASIQSVALYVNADRAGQTFQIGQIVACKAKASADSLTLNSLIGKSSEAAERLWWPILFIRGTMVCLDSYDPKTSNPRTAQSQDPKGYVGTTETAATLKREAIMQAMVASGVATGFQTTEAGTQAAPFTLSGGWDRTDMSTQTGDSWFDGGNTAGQNVAVSHAYWNVERLSFARSIYGLNHASSAFCTIDRIGGAGCVYTFGNTGGYTTASNIRACSAIAIYSQSGSEYSRYSDVVCYGGVPAAQMYSGFCEISNFDFRLAHFGLINGNSGGTNILYLRDGIMNQGAATYASVTYYYGKVFARNVTDGSTVKFSSTALSQDTARMDHNVGGVVDDHRTYMEQAQIVTDSTVAYGTAAYSWKISPLSSTVRGSWYPVRMPLRGIALAANVTKTIGVWMRRDNTGLTMKLVCKGGQIAGVAADVTASMTAAADLWESVSITLTPTETGVVELEAHAYGGATYNGWVSKMEIA